MRKKNANCAKFGGPVLKKNETENFAIEGKKVQFNNRGKGKGIATFYPANFELQMHISEDGFQITSISSSKLNIINIYRSEKSDNNSFIKHLDQLFSSTKTSIFK